ncbi:unnamed protein product [Urochloa humidicola]
MSPPTNAAAVSLAYAPAMGTAGALPYPMLLPFDDGFTDEDLRGADAALLGGVAADADKTRLLLPVCPEANGGGGFAAGLGALAPPASSSGIATAVPAVGAGGSVPRARHQPAPTAPASWEVVATAGTEGGGSPAPAPPSPALPLAQNTGGRTSI